MTDMYIKEDNVLSKDECEFLLGVLLPIAEKHIRKDGEFYPFGAVLLNNNSVEITDTYDGNDYPESKKVIEALIGIHRQFAKEDKIKASGIVWHSSVKDSSNQSSDAIIVSLEHKDNYSVVVAEPYKTRGIAKIRILKFVKFDNLRAYEGKHDIFDKER